LTACRRRTKAATFRIVARAVPEGRVGTPEEVAEVYLYLAEGSYINGAVIGVDGGIRQARDRVW
jgi:NAD(P)-dependent dehydrogenase (short-subunit alcohol dehydrogenase family)